MRKIKVIKSVEDNWYKVGEEYFVKDWDKYQPYGVQVILGDDTKIKPDVVSIGDFEIIEYVI